MIKPSPLQQVRAQFETKDALIGELINKLERFEGESKDDFALRLERVSNKKLLRLHAALSRFEGEFGGDKGALVDAIVTFKNPKQANDQPYKNKLKSYRITRLLDMHDSLKRTA